MNNIRADEFLLKLIKYIQPMPKPEIGCMKDNPVFYLPNKNLSYLFVYW
jgi:hypothetical protein